MCSWIRAVIHPAVPWNNSTYYFYPTAFGWSLSSLHLQQTHMDCFCSEIRQKTVYSWGGIKKTVMSKILRPQKSWQFSWDIRCWEPLRCQSDSIGSLHEACSLGQQELLRLFVFTFPCFPPLLFVLFPSWPQMCISVYACVCIYRLCVCISFKYLDIVFI